MTEFRVRAIVPLSGGVLFIHRIQHSEDGVKEYYVFPGGGIESGESVEECIVREIKEEIGITVVPIRELYRLQSSNKVEMFYLCRYIDGKMGTGTGPEFTSERLSTRGQYIPTVLSLKEISEVDIIAEVKNALLEDLQIYQNLDAVPFRELN